jgi:hypothetical protein
MSSVKNARPQWDQTINVHLLNTEKIVILCIERFADLKQPIIIEFIIITTPLPVDRKRLYKGVEKKCTEIRHKNFEARPGGMIAISRGRLKL